MQSRVAREEAPTTAYRDEIDYLLRLGPEPLRSTRDVVTPVQGLGIDAASVEKNHLARAHIPS